MMTRYRELNMEAEKESGWIYYTFAVPNIEDKEMQCLSVINIVMQSFLKDDAQAKKRILGYLLARNS